MRIKQVLFSFFLPFFTFAQIGVGTQNPNPGTDLHLASENKTLLLNYVSDKTAINSPQDGMIFYDVVEKCFRGIANNTITNCFGANIKDNTPPVVNAEGPGFVGSYIYGHNLVNAKFIVTVTNNSFSLAQIGFNVNDLKLSDSNIKVESVQYIDSSNNLVNIPTDGVTFASGSSYQIVYNLSNSPSKIGKITGQWKKLTLDYENDVNSEYRLDCNNGVWNQAFLESIKNGLITNNTYNGQYTISYNVDATGYDFPAWSQTSHGLTLSTNGGKGTSQGNINFTLSGTFTGNEEDAVTFNIYNYCTVTIYISENCKEILQKYPESVSGLHKVDIDGIGPLKPFNAYCDMNSRMLADGTIDSGGWMLVLNYNHLGGTNPSLNVRSENLPLLGSTTLGSDESNTEYWGHASVSMFAKMNFDEVRFYGISNSTKSQLNNPINTAIANEGRIVDFKTNYRNVINLLKTGNGSMSGLHLPINFTKFANHTAFLPEAAVNNYPSASGDYALTNFPFYQNGVLAWGIGSSNRWEVDDYAIDYRFSTIHQVWVK